MSGLLPVDDALSRILADATPLPHESVPIDRAHGRILAEPLAAKLTQPPFDASAMDGYAVRAADAARIPVTLTVVGEAAAGHPFSGRVEAGQTVRIFTGAPVPGDRKSVV